jgi:hypothetical protein
MSTEESGYTESESVVYAVPPTGAHVNVVE